MLFYFLFLQYFFVFWSWASQRGRVIPTSCATVYVHVHYLKHGVAFRQVWGTFFASPFLESVVPRCFFLWIDCGYTCHDSFDLQLLLWVMQSPRTRMWPRRAIPILDQVRRDDRWCECGIVDEQNHPRIPRNEKWHFRISMKMSLLYHLLSFAQ